MHISENHDLMSGVIGGVIIGISSTGFLYLASKVTGISGLVEDAVLSVDTEDVAIGASYSLGLMSAGVLASVYGTFGSSSSNITAFSTVIIAQGVIVGYGTRMGAGCTSGHGVCGLARYSPRSLTAVMTFMFTGAVAAFANREYNLTEYFPVVDLSALGPVNVISALIPTVATLGIARFFQHPEIAGGLSQKVKKGSSSKKESKINTKSSLAAYLCALVFGGGLVISGMCDSNRVKGFLDFSGPNGWDPSLIGVMGGAVLLNMVTFPLMHYAEVNNLFHGEPIKDSLRLFLHPSNTVINRKLIVGSALFGLGWGLGGICPGPGIVNLGALSMDAVIFIPSLIAGMALHDFFPVV